MSDLAMNKMGGPTAVNYHQVQIDPSANLSPYCSIVGEVKIGKRCTVFAGTHIRGDEKPIVIGDETNIQENCSLHVSDGSALTVGNQVIVGHSAILHGCTIGDNTLVGMGSIVMDDAVVGKNCLIGAGSLITQGKVFEDGTLIMGSPAKPVRKLTPEEIQNALVDAAASYCETGEAMVADGAMVHPAAGVTVWPA